jgi:tRNA(adenine34) deaminase
VPKRGKGDGGRGKGAPPPVTPELAGMAAALAQARRGAKANEVPVGAVVTLADGRVVAEAHNETVKRGDPTAHAELLAIQRAIKALAADRLDGCTLYVTLEPCAQCAGAIVLAKVGRLVFGAYDDKSGMCGSLGDLVRNPRLNHRAEVVGGVEAEASGELLREFFQKRRAGTPSPH